MSRAQRKADPRVLLVYREIIPSVMISALQPLQELERQGVITLAHCSVKSNEVEHHLVWCDIVICARNCFGDEFPFQLKLRQLNIPYIYDCDDNFLRLQHVEDPSVSYLRWPGSIEAVRAYMRYAFAIKVGSAQLAKDCREYNKNCIMQPYCFDMKTLSDLPAAVKDDSVILIGYAGSITHTLDIKIVLEALRKVMKENVNVSFVCYGVSIGGMEEYNQRIKCIPYQNDYCAFLRDFASRGIDIALAPLYDTVTNRSKTNNKYREYSACGIAGIYSDMPVYSNCIRDSENGLLCANDPDAWESALRRLIEDKELRKRIAQRAREDVINNYSIHTAAEKWWDELLLPALAGVMPVEHNERKAILSHGVSERRAWLHEQFGSNREWLLYWLFFGYTNIRQGIKNILSCLGILPIAKRIKAALLDRRMRGMTPTQESRHESI